MSHTAKSESKAGGQPDEGVLIGIAGLCVALNVGLGAIAYLVRAPIYLDAIGTIAIALLAGRMGWKAFALSALVGSASFVITGLAYNPVVIWFIPTQIAIAAFSSYVIRPALSAYLADGRLTSVRAVTQVLLGIGLGIVAGVVSAPIITFVFGGITGAGASFIVAVLLKSGVNLFQSVIASGLASEPIDKTLQLIAAVALVRATPSRIRHLYFERP